MPNQVLTTWDDLSQAGYPKASFSDKYKEVFGKSPDDVHVNEGICVTYGHYCYNIQGDCTYRNRGTTTITRVGAEEQLMNNTDDTVTYHVQLSTSQTKSATVTVTDTTSFSFGNKITVGSKLLGIQAEFSNSFTFTNSTGSSSSTSHSITVTDSIDVPMPPHSKKVAKLNVSWTKMTEDFEIPFTIQGWTGANFPKRVKDHYYWFHTVSPWFGVPQSTLRGTLDCAYDIKGSIEVDPLQALAL